MSHGLKPRIVCAALRHRKTAAIIAGVRHFDAIMHAQIRARKEQEGWVDAEQGFLDSCGNFQTREEAWQIASAHGQIIRECSEPGELYSENLY